MKAIKVPVEGDIELVDLPLENLDRWDTIFQGSLIEQIRFGKPGNPPTMYERGNASVVMLVREDGHAAWGGEQQPLNVRASVLHQAGRHFDTIHGDAYLVMSKRDAVDGDFWSDIIDEYAIPDYWAEVTDS